MLQFATDIQKFDKAYHGYLAGMNSYGRAATAKSWSNDLMNVEALSKVANKVDTFDAHKRALQAYTDLHDKYKKFGKSYRFPGKVLHHEKSMKFLAEVKPDSDFLKKLKQ